MAHVWAKQAGNWTDTTLWAFWNETTQQIEDYGQIPQDGDVVYANGYNIAFQNTSNLTISVGKLSNGEVAYTHRIGGSFIGQSNVGSPLTLNCDIEQGYNNSIISCIGGTSTRNVVVNGNISSNYTGTPAVSVITFALSGANLTVNGNITLDLGFLIKQPTNSNKPITIAINGSITVNSDSIVETGTASNIVGLVITGNCDVYTNSRLINDNIANTTLECLGTLTYRSNFSQNFQSLILNKVNYLQGFPFNLTALIGTSTFEAKYTGAEPNPNPYIIINPNTIAQTYPPENKVLAPTIYGSQMELTGTYTPDFPQEANVLQGVIYDNGNKTGTLAPVVLGDYPDVDKVLVGTIFDYGNKVGTLEPTADYPAEADVKEGVVYDYGQKEGTLSVSADYPPESVVMQGVEYAFGEMTGTMDVSVQVGCVTKEDVREGVALLGMGETGTLVVPSADDVREGVVFDNGTIGTLIVQGGGDRLRIADFSYYTNAQSDTYIVDITEADKPKFASAEERILIEMFPSLDLDNIPEMYFDDLFVKYLKYRLIVEYYRTAGVNSTFTPSEPTTEIVNYRNVTCEVWLNSANIYLNAWNKKYDLNKPPQKIRL